MTFWIILVVLSLAAIGFAIAPLWRSSHRLSPLLATIIVFIVALSAGLYQKIGSPGVPSGRTVESSHGMEQAIESLSARLAANPGDLNGWQMLARTQMSLENYVAAAAAYEQIMRLQDNKVAQTMVDLAVALLNRDQTPIEGRPAALLDSALALEPNNPAALFYAGLGAEYSGDKATAADRWEILLGLNPPANLVPTLKEKIAEWRGETPPAMPMAAQTPAAQPAEDIPADAIVTARVGLSEEAMAAMSTDTFVFIIARDPAAPAPPIAVVLRMLSELPTVISLSDANSMVAGRNLSAYSEIELLARVSLSGGPAAASGDWFGSMLVRPAENSSVTLTINQMVP
jgi:cytochrome c-type biogenesis protein CcmH